MSEISEPEIRVNAGLLAERDRLKERETLLIRANQETEDKRRETVRQLQVANSTIGVLQEAVHNRDESLRLLRDQMTNQSQDANSTCSTSRRPA